LRCRPARCRRTCAADERRLRVRARGTSARAGRCAAAAAAPQAGVAVTTLVIGGGVFGVTAALELRARGHDVTLVDQGRIPHPLAESTDVSKAVRMDYGPDEEYAAHMERALVAWRRNPLFHETGTLYLSRAPMQAGGFERESYRVLTKRGHKLERMTP